MIFSSTRSARQCAERLHLTSKMGNVMTVFVDELGELGATVSSTASFYDFNVKLAIFNTVFRTFMIS